MTEPTWIYKGNIINSIEDFPEGSFGFVYEITHIPSGRKYIGKKNLYTKRTKRIGVRESVKLKEERKQKGIPGRVPSKKLVVAESNWKNYFGSNKELLELLKESKTIDFKREILVIAYHSRQLTYYEAKMLFANNVLEDNVYFNADILGKFHRKDLLKDEE